MNEEDKKNIVAFPFADETSKNSADGCSNLENSSVTSKRLPIELLSKKTASTLKTLDTLLTSEKHWKILVIDNEPDVHNLIRFTLRDYTFQGKVLEVLSAQSAQEAKALLQQYPETAIILLDVVMEMPDTGLKLVEYVRQSLHNHLMRIILITGQPGSAPEKEIITKHDINDYINKTDLLEQRLFTTITTSLRTYVNIVMLELYRQHLEEEYKRAKALNIKLLESEERFRVIAETTPIPLIITRPDDGLILYANAQVKDTFGLSPIAFMGRYITEFYKDPKARDKVREIFAQKGCVLNHEIYMRKADDTPIWVTIFLQAMSYNNEKVMLTAIYDITDRKRAEEQRIQFTQELERLNLAFQRFVPIEFLTLLNKKSIVDVQLADQVEKEMTILFSDIRCFTELSEKMTPQQNFDFINTYLSQMEPIIRQHNGFIDKYIGDAIMALFPICADNAIQSAVAMLKALAHYNQKRQKMGRERIRIGIGINTGLLMLGTVGGKERMDGTVISDAVNLAARIESLTKVYGIPLMITAQTYNKLKNISKYNIRSIDIVKVKGKTQETMVYEVFDADSPTNIFLKNETLFEFNQGFILYHLRKFQEAEPFFEKVLQVNKYDSVARAYLTRCQKVFEKMDI